MSKEAKEAKEALSAQERMANVGMVVTLEKLGDVRVRELSLESILELSSEIALILTSADATGSEGGVQFLVNLLRQPTTLVALKNVAAASTGMTPDDFSGMGATDWLKLATAFKKVIRWEELRDLFLELVPAENLRKMTSEAHTKKR